MVKSIYRVSRLEPVKLIVQRLKHSSSSVSIGSSDQNGVLLEINDTVLVEINPLLTKSFDIRFIITVFSREENELYKTVNGLIKETI